MGSTRASASVALVQTRAPDRNVIAYIADGDDTMLRTIDVATQREIAATPLRGRPEQVLVLADGRVAVTLRFSNALEVLEPAPRADAALESRCVVDTNAEPIALAASPDDSTLMLTSGFAHTLSVLNAATLAPKFEVNLPRDPRSVIVADDGQRAFVAHVVEARVSVVDLDTPSHDVRPVDLRVHVAGEDPAPRLGCQGFALAKVSSIEGESRSKMMDRVFAPMVSVNAGDGSESSGYGNDSPSEISQVMVIDASAERALTRSVKRPANGTAKDECLLPRSAVYDDGALYVTCLGIDSLLQLDARSQDPSHSERKRWHVAAGPTGVAIDRVHHQAIVWSQFEREVAFVPLDSDAPPAGLALARQSGGTPANVAMGRRLFHKMGDERISSDGRACASCHPDGREDAITWSTPDGPRQTPMLAGRVEDTAPYGWMGSSEKVPQHLAKTFERLGGSGLPNDEVTALIDYLKTMAPPRARAVPPEAGRAKLLARGREIFESSEAACSSCHQRGRAYADGERHDVRSSPMAPGAKEAAFDTPSLRFIAGTAPYFHDGRYKTLDDVLVAPDHEMGNARLNRADRAALVAFLETL